MGSGEVYSVDLRGSSVRVTRSGGIVDVVVQPDLHAALPPDVVARPVWTAYLQGRLLWPLAGTVLAFAALVAVLRP
jgi:hypothetical protein